MNKKIKHCKRSYTVVNEYRDNGSKNGIEIIDVSGVIYVVERLPRPANNERDLMCVIVNGKRYPSLANFLKQVS